MLEPAEKIDDVAGHDLVDGHFDQPAVSPNCGLHAH
jgi:hypothetical protein